MTDAVQTHGLHRWKGNVTAALSAFVLAVAALAGCGAETGSPGGSDSPLILSTGPRFGVYHQVSEDLQGAVNRGTLPVDVTLSPSNGSAENLRRLEGGLTDWAILQRDVAVDAYFRATDPFQDLRVLFPLFPEAIQILIHSDQVSSGGVPRGLAELVERLRGGEIDRIAVGPPGSGSNQTLKNILALYGVARDSDVYMEAPYDSCYSAFGAGEVDALGVVVAFPFPSFEWSAGDIRMVSMTPEDVSRITGHVRDLDAVRIPGDTYPYASERVLTVGTWALLVGRMRPGRSMLDGGTGEQLLRTVARAAGSGRYPALEPVRRALEGRGGFRVDSGGADWALRTSSTMDREAFFRGLPVHEQVEEQFPGTAPWMLWVLALAAGAGGWLAFASLSGGRRRGSSKFLRYDDLRQYWLRYKHYGYGLAILVLVYLLVPNLILHFERQFAAQHQVLSPFQNLGMFEVLRWLIVFSVTGYSGGMFPVSPVAEIATTATMPLTWAGVAMAVFLEFLFVQRRKRRRSGMEPVDFEDHVLICGWNEQVPELIEKTIKAGDEFLRGESTRIVVLDSRFREPLEGSESLQRLHRRHELEFIDGEAKDRSALDMANAAEARTIMLVAEERTTEADERTLLRALTISRHCKEVHGAHALDNIYIVAEVNDEGIRDALLKADVNEVVCGPDVTENVLVQSSFNHGLSEILTELLNYNSANEFYLIDADRYDFLVGETFDGALHQLREHDVLLVAIKVGFQNGEGRLIDRERIEENLEEFGLDRQIITNPIYEGESEYRIREEDQLFVLAEDEHSIEEELVQATA